VAAEHVTTLARRYDAADAKIVGRCLKRRGLVN
jgi:hypothetical protein